MNCLVKACCFGVTATLCAMAIGVQNKEMGRMVSLCAGLMLLVFSVTHAEPVVDALNTFAGRAGLKGDTVSLLIRLMAMAWAAEFAVQACQDAGEQGLSMKVSLAGKILLSAQAVPLITQIGQTALSFLP